MSGHLRHDKTCDNCGYTVDIAYCSNCGQKNTETRQPFHHLFTHFAEDLTHYDSAFWKTVKFLLFRPAKLTKEYLEGHRQRYVPPVKLYIFISFVTFFLMAIMAPTIDEKTDKAVLTESFSHMGYTSSAEYDSIQRTLPEIEKDDWLSRNMTKNMLLAKEKGYNLKYFIDSFIKTIPKMLFLYMPIFAFWLWLFHSKKRWYFFDHGIFTLHYFSMLLLLYTINKIIGAIFDLISKELSNGVTSLTSAALAIYAFFYFFRAHSRMYGERKLISRIKSTALFIINLFFMGIALILAVLYIFLNIH